MLPIEGNKDIRDRNGLYSHDKIFQKSSELQGPSAEHELLFPQKSGWTEGSKPWGRQPGWGFHADTNRFCTHPAKAHHEKFYWVTQLESMQLYQQGLTALYTVPKLTFFPLVISLSFIFTSVICWTIWLCLWIVLDSIIAFLIRFLLLFSSICWLLTVTSSLTL